MKRVYHHKMYFILLAIFFLISSGFLAYHGKAKSFILLNTYHSGFFNQFFKLYTYLGDGFFSLAVTGIFLMAKKWKSALMVFAAYASSGIFVQIIKALFNSPRPISYFKPEEYSKFIEGLNTHKTGSFASGHTTSAFALSLILALMLDSRPKGVVLLLMAILVGYSRIYLGQHFLTDVIGGALIGSIFAFLCYTLINERKIGN